MFIELRKILLLHNEWVIGHITLEQKCSKSQIWEAECGALKCLCVLVVGKRNSLWHYTTLPSYTFKEWMISKIAVVQNLSVLPKWLNFEIILLKNCVIIRLHFGIKISFFNDVGYKPYEFWLHCKCLHLKTNLFIS
jgi:hypothetical protein